MSVSNPTRMFLLQYIDTELKQHDNILSFHQNQEEENLSFIVEFEETYSYAKNNESVHSDANTYYKSSIRFSDLNQTRPDTILSLPTIDFKNEKAKSSKILLHSYCSTLKAMLPLRKKTMKRRVKNKITTIMLPTSALEKIKEKFYNRPKKNRAISINEGKEQKIE